MNALTEQNESTEEKDFLLQAATLLHRFGTPSYRLERVMKGLSSKLGIDADFFYTPTSLLVAFRHGIHRTLLSRIEPSSPNLGKLIELDSAMDELADRKVNCAEARQRLEEIEQAPSRFGFMTMLLASCLASAGATILLGGGIPEAIFACFAGGMVHVLGSLLDRFAPNEHLLEILAGFFTAAAAIAAGQILHPQIPFDQGVACLGSLIVLLPGFTLTIAIAELANRHLSCGVARLAGAIVVLFALVCGVGMAFRLGASWRLPPPEQIWMPEWIYFLAVLTIPISFGILFQARIKEWPIISAVIWIGFFTATLAGSWQGGEFGAFAGSLALASIANLYARVWDRPAMVGQMPGILALVPGSLGFRSLTAFVDQNGLLGIETAFATANVAISIVGGLLVSNLIIPPKRIL